MNSFTAQAKVSTSKTAAAVAWEAALLEGYFKHMGIPRYKGLDKTKDKFWKEFSLKKCGVVALDARPLRGEVLVETHGGEVKWVHIKDFHTVARTGYYIDRYGRKQYRAGQGDPLWKAYKVLDIFPDARARQEKLAEEYIGYAQHRYKFKDLFPDYPDDE